MKIVVVRIPGVAWDAAQHSATLIEHLAEFEQFQHGNGTQWRARLAKPIARQISQELASLRLDMSTKTRAALDRVILRTLSDVRSPDNNWLGEVQR